MPLSKLLFTALLALASSSYAAADVSGPNCDISEPPADAGYYAMLGIPMRVHPAPSSINAKYNGCQSLWSFEENVPKLEMKIVFRAGKPTSVAGGPLDEKTYPLVCSANRKEDSQAFDCTPFGQLPFPSLPKECLKFRESPPDSRGHYIDRACH